MSQSRIEGFRIAGISTCQPPLAIDNLDPALGFSADDVRKVVAMAGVRERRVVPPTVTSADLCYQAASTLLERLDWERDSISALIFVTQTPDYFLPSSSCLLQHRLGLSDDCAAFDLGLGCSGYPYGLYVAASLLRSGGHRRVLLLHGETPSRFVSPDDQATVLLFADAGSATALELCPDGTGGHFVLHTDGSGAEGLILRGGGFRDRHPANQRHQFLEMDGAAIFNFTIKRVPPLIEESLTFAGISVEDVDAFVFHQSNRFIMKHLMKKSKLPEDRVPICIEDSGNCGGPSVAVTLTRRLATPSAGQTQRCLLLGYGVGLSWGSALVQIDDRTILIHDNGDGQPLA
jgi:3-oxoacyl-[acyl-carrier-protein] synthase III